jgi:hypothetical protein
MNLLQLLLFTGSRKVSFGLYLFCVSNAFLIYKLISSDQWFTCIALCTALIGGGTVADRFLETKGKKPELNGKAE